MAEKEPTKIGSKEWQMEHLVVDLNEMAKDVKSIRGDLHFIFIFYVITFVLALLGFLFLIK